TTGAGIILAFTHTTCICADTNGNSSVLQTDAWSIGIQAGAGMGFTVQVSDANTVDDLLGWSVGASAALGPFACEVDQSGFSTVVSGGLAKAIGAEFGAAIVVGYTSKHGSGYDPMAHEDREP